MNKYFLFLLIFFIGGKSLFGQSYPVTVLSKQPLEALPGEISTIVLKIYNDDTLAVNLIPDFVKQDNISCIMCRQLISIEPKTEKTIILPLLINKNTQPGLLKFVYLLRREDSIIIEKEMTISIEKKVEFSISMINAPEFVRGGEQISAKTLIQNNGNIEADFKISKYGFTDEMPDKIVLKPGEIYYYDIAINTNPNQAKADFLTYGLRVMSIFDTSKRHDVFHSTYVFPVSETKKSQYFVIPGYIKLNYLLSDRANSSASGYQIEAFFKGSLDQANKHKVELLVRGPNRFSSSVLGTYDEYYLKYKNKNYDVHLGDKVYMLTPLTEMSRFARGVEASGTKANFTLGGFYAIPRFNSSIKSEYAGYASYLFKNNVRLGVNHLSKQELNTDAKINSVIGSYAFKEKFSVETELSQSIQSKVKDYGFRSSLLFQQKKIYMTLSAIITGRNYAGYYKNTSYYVFNSTYKLNEKTDLNLNYNKDYQTPLLDTIIFIAPSNTSYFIGVTRRFKKNLSTRLLYRSLSVYDRSELKSFNYKSNQIQLTVNQQFKKFSYNMMGDIGLNRNMLATEDSSLSTITSLYTEFQYSPSRNFSFGVFQNFMNSNRYSLQNSNSFFYGGNITWIPGTSFYASLRYQSNYFPEDYYRNRDALDLRIKYSATRRLDFSAAVRYIFLAQQKNTKELYVLFSCNYKINIPVKKIASYGKVSGVINTRTGKEVKDILLHLNGRTAITRKDGSFVFNNVPPGEYFLFVDQSSLNLNEIVEQLTPVKVEVSENKTSIVNLNIINGAKITGKVNVVFKKGAYYDDTLMAIIPSVVLILKNEHESQTIVSDEDGNFSFKNIKPGDWDLHVYDNLLDGKYILETEEYKLNLQSGQNQEIQINIRKKDKKIKFLQQAPGPKK